MTVPARYRGAPTSAAARAPAVWEPTWSEPMAPLRVLSPRVSRLLDELLGDWPGFSALTEEGTSARLGETPLGDLEELDDAWLVRMEMPGVRQEDIDIQLTGRRLVVRGERRETERKGVLRRNTRTAGRYYLDVELPGEVDPDEVEATLENGVLTVRVAKPEAERGGARKIEISQPGRK
jgi:HSP20 family protein